MKMYYEITASSLVTLKLSDSRSNNLLTNNCYDAHLVMQTSYNFSWLIAVETGSTSTCRVLESVLFNTSDVHWFSTITRASQSWSKATIRFSDWLIILSLQNKCCESHNYKNTNVFTLLITSFNQHNFQYISQNITRTSLRCNNKNYLKCKRVSLC